MDLLATANPPDVIAARTAAIREALVQSSPNIREGNFTRIGTEDLAALFAGYDREFFGGWLAQAVAAPHPGRWRFDFPAP